MSALDRPAPTPAGRLSKSLMTSLCQRQGWYKDHVRDRDGYKLRFGMPERVIFGSAVDAAHLELTFAASEGKEPDLALAVKKGMERARTGLFSEPIDWTVFEIQLQNAMTLFLSSPNGLSRIPLEGIRFQVALESDDIYGPPDYLLDEADGESVLDVKTSKRRKTVNDFYRSAEMPIYTLLKAAEHGALPKRLIYQVYVRVTKPYWDWVEVPGIAGLVSLGKAHAAHWRAILAAPVEAAAFDTTFCGDCGYREAIPEVGHSGCAVGQSMPVTEELEEAA